jgi:hypothetical protein
MTDVLEEQDREQAVLDSLLVARKNYVLSTSYRSSVKSARSKRRGVRRNVMFSDEGHDSQEYEMYSYDEALEAWYQCGDYEAMKSGFEFTIFMMDAGCPEKVEDDEHTCRGLEKRCEEGQWKRHERKRHYYDVVLDEQERQWDHQEDDQEKISQLSVEVNAESLMEAYDFGVFDEIAVYGHALRLRCPTVYDTGAGETLSLSEDIDLDATTTDLTLSSNSGMSDLGCVCLTGYW